MSGSKVQAFSSRPIGSISRHDLNLPSAWQFFDPSSPWVLVNEGSLMGTFDFVPKKLRVGPWTTFAPIFVLAIVAKLIYWMPQQSSFHFDDEILSTHPPAYSAFWAYNLAAFFWMVLVLLMSLQKRGPGIIFTYTIISWMMLIIRHGLSALAPILPANHILLWINEMLRFPALANASVTFFFWNFIIAPMIYYNYDDAKRRRDFLQFNFQFRLIQLHLFNIAFAVMNTVVTSSREFQVVDLWCALAGAIGYALMYLLIFDRIGVHLYPVFSPRTHWSVLSWMTMLGSYFAVFHFWNHIISSGLIS